MFNKIKKLIDDYHKFYNSPRIQIFYTIIWLVICCDAFATGDYVLLGVGVIFITTHVLFLWSCRQKKLENGN